MGVLLQQDEWRFVITTRGAQCVMMVLEVRRPMWCADSLGYHSHVRRKICMHSHISSPLDRTCMDIYSL